MRATLRMAGSTSTITRGGSMWQLLSVMIFTALSVVSCTTLESLGDDFVENGQYREAVEMYERALVEDPGDAEIMAKLESARMMTIDKQLIAIRKLRMAQNWTEGSRSLEEVLKFQQKWKSAPTGKVAFTQNEEVGFFAAHLHEKIENMIQANKPFEARWNLKSFELILRARSKHEALMASAQATGKKYCDTNLSAITIKQAFYAYFLNSQCSKLFATNHQRAEKIALGIEDVLYTSAKVSADIDGRELGDDRARKTTEQAFQESVWYLSRGKRKASASVDGNLSIQHTRSSDQLTYTSTYQVPYTEYETRNVSRYVPCSQCPGGGRTEYQQEQVPVTKYRSETQVIPYTVFRLDSSYRTKLQGSFQLDSIDVSFAVADQKAKTQTNDSRYTRQTYPEPEISNQKYIDDRLDDLKTEIKVNLAKAWAGHHCENLQGGQSESHWERLAKCAYLRTPLAIDRVRTSFRGAFGIGIEEFTAL